MAPFIDFNSKKVKKRMGFINGFGAAIVVIGALFKILHLPGGDVVIGLGLTTEALLFMIGAFEPIPISYHWENVYPVLLDDNHHNHMGDHMDIGDKHFSTKEEGYADYSKEEYDYRSKSSSVNRISNIGNSIDINKDIVEKLENSVKQFTRVLNAFSQIESISYLNQKVNDYSNQMTIATQRMSSLNQVYSDQIESYDSHLRLESELISTLSMSIDSAKGIRGELEVLKGNLNSLNSVYGGMLSVINK